MIQLGRPFRALGLSLVVAVAGESYNFGLLNQQDQPYTEMTDIMRDMNRTLEQVHQQGAATQVPAGQVTGG